jgi:hypothetical protein
VYFRLTARDPRVHDTVETASAAARAAPLLIELQRLTGAIIDG